MNKSKARSTFYTDQNRWEYRDFGPEEEENSSLSEGADEELEVQEDVYHPPLEKHLHPDAELEKVIKELLHNSNRIDARDITVTVTHCNVVLSGTVRTQEDRDYALSLVELIHGVGHVESDLIVKINEGILPSDIGRDSTL